MIRKILGAVAGYVAMAIFTVVTFTVLYSMLGAGGTFEPGSFNVSINWVIYSMALSFIAALDGGFVCMIISRNKNTILILAGIVLVAGLASAFPKLYITGEAIRSGYVSHIEAMKNAIQPAFELLLNPVLGAIGIYGGSFLVQKK